MSDDTSQTNAQDRTRVNVNQDYELRYWSDKFGCTHDELKAAVKAVGVVAKDVEAHLASRR